MAKLSVSILFGERVAATHFIDVDDRSFLGVERSDLEIGLKEMSVRLEKLGKQRRDQSSKQR